MKTRIPLQEERFHHAGADPQLAQVWTNGKGEYALLPNEDPANNTVLCPTQPLPAVRDGRQVVINTRNARRRVAAAHS